MPDLLAWRVERCAAASCPWGDVDAAEAAADAAAGGAVRGAARPASPLPLGAAEPSSPNYCFIEVKSSNDRLSERQFGWFRAFARAGIHALVLRVHAERAGARETSRG
jgi:hypothetical protein